MAYRSTRFISFLKRKRHRIRAVLLILLPFLLVISSWLWSLGVVVDNERKVLQQHFFLLTDQLGQQETFLGLISRSEAFQHSSASRQINQVSTQLYEQDGLQIYEVREFPYTMPYTLAIDTSLPGSKENPQRFFLYGSEIANFYGMFWASSPVPLPQMFVFGLNNKGGLAIPATTERYGINSSTFEMMADVRRTVREADDDDPGVHWRWLGQSEGSLLPNRLISFLHMSIPEAFWWSEHETDGLVVTLLDMQKLEAQLQRPVSYSDILLVSPEGQLLGTDVSLYEVEDREVSLSRKGVIVRIAKESDTWTGYYRMDYLYLMWLGRWYLLGALIFLGVLWACAGLLRKANRRRLSGIEQRLRHKLRQTTALSQAMFDSTTMGARVLSRETGTLLLENTRARLWLAGRPGVAEWQSWLLANGALHTELCTWMCNERYRVRVTPMRYEGQEALLCLYTPILPQDMSNATAQAMVEMLHKTGSDLRIPLYDMLSSLEALRRGKTSDRQHLELNTIRNSCTRLLYALGDIFSMSREGAVSPFVDDIEFCPLDLAEDLLAEYLADAVRKGLALYICIEPEVPGIVRGDPVLIRHIMRNLLSNALRFTHFGRIVIRVRSGNRLGDQMSLLWQVSDTGIGMEPVQQAHLFGPEKSFRGALSLSQGLARLMGRGLQVVSNPGLGSSFTLDVMTDVVQDKLPNLEDVEIRHSRVFVYSPFKELTDNLCLWLRFMGADAIATCGEVEHAINEDVRLELLETLDTPWQGARVVVTAPTQDSLPTGSTWFARPFDLRAIFRAVAIAQRDGDSAAIEVGQTVVARSDNKVMTRPENKKVLLVEDNAINRHLLSDQLAELGFEVVQAQDGEQALKLWAPGEFSLVLTDINMPRMDGYELTEALRRQGFTKPILGITANAREQVTELASQAGMDECLFKPISLSALRYALEKHVDEPLVNIVIHEQDQDSEEEEHHTIVAERIQVPERMRAVFIKTMMDDVEEAQQALIQRDVKAVGQKLHRMRGAFAVVNAADLAAECAILEQVTDEVTQFDDELVQDVEHLLQQILLSLEKTA